MPSHGRGSYRAARAATKVLNEEHSRLMEDVERLQAAWQEERARADAAEEAAQSFMRRMQERSERMVAAEAKLARVREVLDGECGDVADMTTWDLHREIRAAIEGDNQ